MAATAQKGTRKSKKNLFISQDNGWTAINKREQKSIFTFCEDYRQFLSSVKTEREACRQGVSLSKKHGFKDLEGIIRAKKQLKPGDKIYIDRAGKTLTSEKSSEQSAPFSTQS